MRSLSRIVAVFLCFYTPTVLAHGGEGLVILGAIFFVALVLVILSLCVKATWWQRLALILLPWGIVWLLSMAVTFLLQYLGIRWGVNDWNVFFSTIAVGPASVWLLCLWYFRGIPASIRLLTKKLFSLGCGFFSWVSLAIQAARRLSMRLYHLDAIDLQRYRAQLSALGLRRILQCCVSIWIAWFFSFIISMQVTQLLVYRLDMDAWASFCSTQGTEWFFACFSLPSWGIQIVLISTALYYWTKRFLSRYFTHNDVPPMQTLVLFLMVIGLPLLIVAMMYQLILFNALSAISIAIAIHHYFSKKLIVEA